MYPEPVICKLQFTSDIDQTLFPFDIINERSAMYQVHTDKTKSEAKEYGTKLNGEHARITDRRATTATQIATQLMMQNRPHMAAQRAIQSQAHNSHINQKNALPNAENEHQAADVELGLVDAVQLRTAQSSPPAEKPNNSGLPDALKSGIESLSGISLDHVKVHYNSNKPAQLSAHAYAQGSDIHIAPRQEKHLPHEAWHVVQQAQGRVKPTMQMRSNIRVNDDAGLERAADAIGAIASSGHKKNSLASHSIQTEKPGLLSSGVIQPKLAVQIVPNLEENNIDGLTVGGRAGSLWTKERHHTTPWQSYVDHLQGQLAGLTLLEASERMLLIGNSLDALPGMQLVWHLENKKLMKFLTVFHEMIDHGRTLAEMKENTPDSNFLPLVLQQYMSAYVNVLTLMPLAQSDVGGGATRVAKDTEIVKTANTGQDVNQAKLQNALQNMFDFNTLPDDDNDDGFANLGLEKSDEFTQQDLRQMMFRQHAESMRASYPIAFAKAFGDLRTMVHAMESFDQTEDSDASENSDASERSDDDSFEY